MLYLERLATYPCDLPAIKNPPQTPLENDVRDRIEHAGSLADFIAHAKAVAYTATGVPSARAYIPKHAGLPLQILHPIVVSPEHVPDAPASHATQDDRNKKKNKNKNKPRWKTAQKQARDAAIAAAAEASSAAAAEASRSVGAAGGAATPDAAWAASTTR